MPAGTDDYLILFADLIGSTDVASELSPDDFARHYVSSFHWAATQAQRYIVPETDQEPFDDEDAHFQARIENAKPKGDEVICFRKLSRDLDDRKLQDIAASAVAFAYIVKLYWLAAPYNLGRLLTHQFPRDVGVGLHIGPAAIVTASPEHDDIASLHINVAKRMEQASRNGTASRIFASLDVADRFQAWRDRVEEQTDPNGHPPLVYATFQPGKPIGVKGLPTRLLLCELVPTVFDRRQEEDVEKDRLGFWRKVGHEADMDSGVAKASRLMAENFFGKHGMFKGQDGASMVKLRLENVTSPRDYIAKWFAAMERRSKLFLGEPWLLFNCYFMSCAFVRHGQVEPRDAASYRGILERLWNDADRAWHRMKRAFGT